MSRHLYISTGEVSGEQHAARLVRALVDIEPALRFSGMGGDILRAADVGTVVDTAGRHVMGFLEVVAHLPFLKKAFDASLQHILDSQPEAVLLVDYPGFHLRLARAIRKNRPDLPILYYIAPKVWAWNEGRVETIRACVDKLLCILPFEERWFAERNVAAEYVGNPVRDAVAEAGNGDEIRHALGLKPGTRLVSIFPGSRASEIRRMFPALAGAARILSEKAAARGATLRFAVAVAPGFSRESVLALDPAAAADFAWVEGRSHSLLAASDFVFAKSGTTTLEAALLGVPMTVVYRTNWLTAALAWRLVKIPYAALPNIVAGREIVPELLQRAGTPERLAEVAESLLFDEAKRAGTKRDLAAVADAFGTAPAAERAAEAVLRFLGARASA